MLLQIAGFLSFLWLNNFPLCILCIYTHHSFSFRAIEDVYFPLYSHLKNILTCTTDGMKHCLVIKYHNDNHSQSRTSRLTGSCPAQCPHPDTAHLHKDTHSLLIFKISLKSQMYTCFNHIRRHCKAFRTVNSWG